MGVFLLVPAAIVMTMLWAWRRIRGSEERAIEGSGTLQQRQGTCVEFTIPSSTVGYIIGRQGQRVRELERNSGARIRFKDLQEGEDKV